MGFDAHALAYLSPPLLNSLSALNKELDTPPPIYEGGGTGQKHASTTCGETNHS
jgi:hypothetical protein